MGSEEHQITEQGVLTLPEATWREAQRRQQVIAPLAAQEGISHQAADDAAQQLGLSRRHIYELVRRYRQGAGLLTDLAPGQSSGGKGKQRLPEQIERIIRELLHKRFLTKHKRSLAALYREIVQSCGRQHAIPFP
ncbi:helix-turn-helix domain-containing protein [Candidatus Regiella insecticola]